MEQHLKVILSGGGTGGHIYPAVAIANEVKWRFPQAEILFIGAKDKMEMQKIPQSGYPIIGLWISGLQRKQIFKNLLFPIKLMHSLYKARKIIKKFRPDVVVGTGGFASGPLLWIAQHRGIFTVIQEQNSFPGITNKLLGKKAHAICVAYQNLDRFFPKNKIVITGNPVRQDLLQIENKKEEALSHFNLILGKKTVLILGGSLGAGRINQLVVKQLIDLIPEGIQLLWQCGTLYYDQYQSYDQKEGVKVLPFIEKMDLAYAAADIILSRAGALSVSELCIVGKPVVFIPSPNVTDDHQTKNAQAIVMKKGALMMKETELEDHFGTLFTLLLQNDSLQRDMIDHIKKLAKPNATKDIVDVMMGGLNHKRKYLNNKELTINHEK